MPPFDLPFVGNGKPRRVFASIFFLQPFIKELLIDGFFCEDGSPMLGEDLSNFIRVCCGTAQSRLGAPGVEAPEPVALETGKETAEIEKC